MSDEATIRAGQHSEITRDCGCRYLSYPPSRRHYLHHCETHADEDLAMQVRCLHCLREQYALAVVGVSTGEYGCAWCGVVGTPMNDQQYRDALAQRRGQSGVWV